MAREELWPVARLIPNPRNARTHTPEQVKKIAASIREFGWTCLPLVDAAGNIIAGHGRRLAAIELGLAEVPVRILDHLTAAQARAYLLADNRLAEDASWDEKLLVEELEALSVDGVDLAVTGFSAKELDELLQPPDADPGADPEARDTAPKLGSLSYRVLVECADEHEQARMLERFSHEGLRARAVMM